MTKNSKFLDADKLGTGAGKPDIDAGKPDIGAGKPDIGAGKPDIDEWSIRGNVRPRTLEQIDMLMSNLVEKAYFGRSDIMNVLGIGPSRASDLIGTMGKLGIIESVSGHGKGKYRFCSSDE